MDTALIDHCNVIHYNANDTPGRVHPFRTDHECDLENALIRAQLGWYQTADEPQTALAAIEGLERRVKWLERLK